LTKSFSKEKTIKKYSNYLQKWFQINR